MRPLLPGLILLLLLGALFAACGGDNSDDPEPRTAAATFEDDATPGADSSPMALDTRDDLGVIDSHRPRVGEPAPDFALLDARDGVTVRKLSDFRGKAVVLNWYASWCGPCKAEIPEFQRAAAALEDEVVFVGVNFKETQDRAQGILDIFAAKYPAVLDTEGAVGDHYRVIGLPVTYFIDADGIVRGIRIGQVRIDDLEENLQKAGVEYEAAE